MKSRGKRPEEKIQDDFIKFLIYRGWYVISTHGNAYQAGFPDLFCAHTSYGTRWVECKVPKGYRFTEAQLTVFTKFDSKRVGVWIITAGTQTEYDKLFGPSNVVGYLMNSRGITLKDKIKIIPKSGPEALIQNSIIAKLMAEDWFCIETYGSQFQSGFPDIYACHAKYGTRWIECKNPKGYRFTPAQLKVFPRFMAEGVGVWILTSPDETPKLFGQANWFEYLK